MLRLDIKGSLLIAPEGINGTLAGTREGMDGFLDYLRKDIIKGPFEHKESLCDHQPFKRTKVRLKKETISLGVSPSPALPRIAAGEGEKIPSPVLHGGGSGRGAFIEPKDWNALIADPDVVLLDARNSYETHLGTFAGAIDPNTQNFKQLPDFIRHTLSNAKQKKIATFCTGGIRCEKLAPWMAAQGFEEVYQLKGGILKYLEEIPQEESKWQGECFVFDNRVAVGHGLVPSRDATMCRPCGQPLTAEDRAHPLYMEDVRCPYCPAKGDND